ncbi:MULTISPECIES: WXG100 family type VII secretion target [unclassified Streptomyces]|uniref:WXG100 family type VII secretion target n=1 Tax=unclassified Streptomyces TaxID=2593676 RepID=UPI000DB9D158|nr:MULTISPECIES: WXG100 family type VII secretion target [unclassified Streptomyces]MYT73325.1 WXG100 family type VII secretion target [Streptomyces sp. SID8367]RAJ74926.1 WXG100 family type VII secretion target [Streptomyces sp. PsTaAH-137]
MLDDGTAYVDANGRSKLAKIFETYVYDPQSRLRSFRRRSGEEAITDGFGLLTESDEINAASIGSSHGMADSVDLVNPDALEAAAKAWRRMHDGVQRMFSGLDREVSRAVGETWRGEAADAFHAHWRELHKVVEHVLPDFENAAEGLDEAADNIRKVKAEIHEIYLEIGIAIAAAKKLGESLRDQVKEGWLAGVIVAETGRDTRAGKPHAGSRAGNDIRSVLG